LLVHYHKTPNYYWLKEGHVTSSINTYFLVDCLFPGNMNRTKFWLADIHTAFVTKWQPESTEWNSFYLFDYLMAYSNRVDMHNGIHMVAILCIHECNFVLWLLPQLTVLNETLMTVNIMHATVW